MTAEQFGMSVGLGLGFFIGLATGIGLMLIGEWLDKRRARAVSPPLTPRKGSMDFGFLPTSGARVTDNSVFYRDHWGRMRRMDRGVYERALKEAGKLLIEGGERKN